MLYFPRSFQNVMKWLISGTYHFISRKLESYLQVQCHSRVQLQASMFQLGLLYVFLLHLYRKTSHLFCKVEISMMRGTNQNGDRMLNNHAPIENVQNTRQVLLEMEILVEQYLFQKTHLSFSSFLSSELALLQNSSCL